MKATNSKRHLIAPLALLAVISCGTNVRAESQVLNAEESFDVTDKGDATARMKLSLTAVQYINWKQHYGMNPSLFKRDVSKTTSQYEACDFKLEQNDMEREVKVSYTGKGLVKHLGNGKYELRVPKAWKSGERVGNEYRFHYPEAMAPGVICQHAVTIKLPAGAGNFSEQLSEMGEKVIRYQMPVAGGPTGWLSGSVASLLLCGASVAGVVTVGRREKPACIEVTPESVSTETVRIAA